MKTFETSALAVLLVALIHAQPCPINIANWPKTKFGPVYTLATNGGIAPFTPSNNTHNFMPNQKLIILCGQHHIEFTCNGGLMTKADNTLMDLSGLTCAKVYYEVQATLDPCGPANRAHIVKVGYRNSLYGFATLYETCFENHTAKAHYTHYNVNPYQATKTNENRQPFDNTMFPEPYNKISEQIRYFEALFGSNQTMLTSKHYFAAGHYAPCANFFFPYENAATCTYLNSAPEWHSLNNNNWRRIEAWVRKQSKIRDLTFEIYTGSFGFLQLRNIANAIISLQLSGIIVPKYFFKVVKNQNEAIVFVSDNGIDSIQPPNSCTNVCPALGLPQIMLDNFRIPNKGLTICCTLMDFQSGNTILPVFPATNLLVHH